MLAKKLRLIGVFAVLLALALAVGCKGFFVNPTLNSITVGPTSSNIPVGQTQQMQATGTYSDGSQKNITSTSGIVWQSSDANQATVSGSGVVKGVAAGTPTSSNIASNGGTATFQAMANVSGQSTQIDVSAQVTWSISDTTNFTLTQNVSPETVTAGSGAQSGQTVTLTATYTSGTTQFPATAKLTVQ